MRKGVKGFTISKYNPDIFIIEICDQHPDFIHNSKIMDKYKILRKYFDDNHYKLLVNDIVDNVYIREDIYNRLNLDFIQRIKQMVKFPQFTPISH